MAPTTAEALTAGGPFLDAKYGAYRSWEQDKWLPADDAWSARFDELARDRFLLGDPARVREEIARYRERLGVTTLIVRVQWPRQGAGGGAPLDPPARRAGPAQAPRLNQPRAVSGTKGAYRS